MFSYPGYGFHLFGRGGWGVGVLVFCFGVARRCSDGAVRIEARCFRRCCEIYRWTTTYICWSCVYNLYGSKVINMFISQSHHHRVTPHVPRSKMTYQPTCTRPSTSVTAPSPRHKHNAASLRPPTRRPRTLSSVLSMRAHKTPRTSPLPPISGAVCKWRLSNAVRAG